MASFDPTEFDPDQSSQSQDPLVAASQARTKAMNAQSAKDHATPIEDATGIIGAIIGAYAGGPAGGVAGWKAGQGVGATVTGQKAPSMPGIDQLQSVLDSYSGSDKKTNPDGTPVAPTTPTVGPAEGLVDTY